MSDTPRTECYVLNPLPQVVSAEWARQLERELNAANDRIKSLIEERDRANRLAEWKWNLRDEFQLLLGTDKIEEGIEAVKELKRRIHWLEGESESRYNLMQSAIGNCVKMSARIQRLEDVAEDLVEQNDIYIRRQEWRKAKEDKP